MNMLILAIFLFLTSGCAPGGSGGAAAKFTPTDPAPPVIDPNNPAAVSVTYYALSRTEAPVNGWPNKPYTATGYCATIASLTYCWSDGLKTLTWVSNNITYGPLYYNYWNLSTSNGNPQTCHGGCADDYLSTPHIVTVPLSAYVSAPEVFDIFTTGTPTTIACLRVNNDLNCGSVTFPGVY